MNKRTQKNALLSLPALLCFALIGLSACSHTHSYEVSATKAATCTEDGTTTYTCTGCGESYSETLPALGHDYVGGACARCGLAEIPEGYSVGLDYELLSNGSYALVGIGNFAGEALVLSPSYRGAAVTEIGEGALSGSEIVSAVLPDSVRTIGKNAFSGCASLSSVTLPKSLTNLGEGAFANCTALEEIALPETLTSLGEGAFRFTALRELSLPQGVQDIPAELVAWSKLERIFVPASVEKVGADAFQGCGGTLQNVYFAGTETMWNDIEGLYMSGLFSDVTVHFEADALP